MILTDADMELYHGPMTGDVPFNYKSKLFKSTWDKLKGIAKTCEFCGNTKLRIKDTHDSNGCRYISVVCSSCKAVGPRSYYNIWHDGNDKWHLYDKDFADITKEEVIQTAINLWNA